MIKQKIAKLIDLKSIITVVMTVGMVLMLCGVFTPRAEVFALFSATYSSVMTYYFTKKKSAEDKEE